VAKKFKNVSVQQQQSWLDEHYQSREVGNVYLPLWTVHDISSSGVKCKIQHFGYPRTTQLLSQNEVCQFLLLAYDKTVVDAFEQYALPLNETLTIARELGVKHPVYPGTKTPIAQTLDFMAVTVDGQRKGYAVKQQAEVFRERTAEKLAIQEAWCLTNGVKYKLATSDELKIEPVRNLERLYRHRKLLPMPDRLSNAWLSNFVGCLSEDRFERVSNLLERAAKLTGVIFDYSAHFFYYHVWHSNLSFNFERPLFLEHCADDLELYPVNTDLHTAEVGEF